MWSTIIVLGEEGEGQSPFIRELNDSRVYNGSTFCKFQSHSQFESVINLQSTRHEKEATPSWWRRSGLVEPSAREQLDDVRIDKDSTHVRNIMHATFVCMGTAHAQ